MRSEKYFRGSVSEQEFRLIPVFEGRNIYIPVIHGDLNPSEAGTQVRFTFALHPLAVGLLVMFCIMPFWTQYNEFGHLSRNVLIIPGIVLGFHALFYYIGFLPETRRTEKFLRDLLGVFE